MTEPTLIHADLGSLNGVSLDRIWNARLQVHHALQIPAALHASRYTPRDDQSHTAFRVERGDFVSLGDPAVPWRAALRPDTLTVELLDGVGDAAGSVPLEGLTLEQAYGRFASMLDERAGPGRFARLEAELPAHPVAEGAAFELDGPAVHGLRVMFHDAAALLDELRPQLTHPSVARLWPHHFDLAVLDDLDAESGFDLESRRSIGIGLTPGDEGMREPYLYVTLWPYPASPELPALPDGAWTSEGWVGAALPIRTLAEDTPAGRSARARTFVDAAIADARRMLTEEDGA